MIAFIFKVILGIFLPWVLFLLMGKVGAAALALALQATVIGWIPASIWALKALITETKNKKPVPPPKKPNKL